MSTIEERLGPEMVQALRATFTYHDEFLDIWKAMNEGEPDAFVEMGTSAVGPDDRRRRRMETLDDE